MKTPVKPSALRREIGSTACYEVGALANMLHDWLERHDTTGEIAPSMRGGLLRLSKLSDIVYEALVVEDPEKSDQDLINALGGMDILGLREAS